MQDNIFKVFLTGYSTQKLTNKILNTSLKGRIEGFVSVQIPGKKYQGYAFIEVEGKQNLDSLLKRKKLMINNERFLLKPYKKGKALGDFKEDVNKRKVFIHNIPNTWKNTQLFQLFNQYGDVEDAFICKNLKEAGNQYKKFERKSTKSGRCIGFVVFKSEKPANVVCQKQAVYFMNEVINVEPAMISKNEAKKKKSENSEKGRNSVFYIKKTKEESSKSYGDQGNRVINQMNMELQYQNQEDFDTLRGGYRGSNSPNFEQKIGTFNPRIGSFGNKERTDHPEKNYYPKFEEKKIKKKDKSKRKKNIHPEEPNFDPLYPSSHNNLYSNYHVDYTEKEHYIWNNWNDYLEYQTLNPSKKGYFFFRAKFQFYPDQDIENYRLNFIGKKGKKRFEKRTLRGIMMLEEQDQRFFRKY